MPNFFCLQLWSSKTVKQFVKNSQTIRQNAAWSSPTFVFIQKQQFSWKKCHLFKNLPSVNFLFYLFILVTHFLYNVIIYYLHHRCWFTTVKNPCLTWFQPRRGFILFSLLLDNGVKIFIGLYYNFLKGVFSKSSGNQIVAPIFCLLS